MGQILVKYTGSKIIRIRQEYLKELQSDINDVHTLI